MTTPGEEDEMLALLKKIPQYKKCKKYEEYQKS